MASDYKLQPDGRFTIRHFASKKPFSNFLPAIAGLNGTPLWAFYVNRGQGMASFGTKNKDQAILEFFPANKAYQMVSSNGFRTFVKDRAHGWFAEPFGAAAEKNDSVMEISSHEFTIQETNSHGLQTTVTYFTVPSEPLAALVREVTFKNVSSKAMDLDVIDGLPMISPFGMNEFFMKSMSRTIEAWMQVENVEKKTPYLRLRVDATDRPEVTFIEEGNFHFACVEEKNGPSVLLDTISDPAVVFGSALDFSSPRAFLAGGMSWPGHQILSSRTPSAFIHTSFKLAPGRSQVIHSVFGQSRDKESVNRYVQRARRRGYFAEKRAENKRLIENVKNPLFTVTSSQTYDLYCGQTYLDNIMRGGMPVPLSRAGRGLTFYAYARKHGDLERDYNRFLVEPDYMAQGDGNYRDVNQNRRNDVWFEPQVKDANIRTFLNLVQLDGFNPLVIKGTDYNLDHSKEARRIVETYLGAKEAQASEEFLSKPFKLGELYRRWVEKGHLAPSRFQQFVEELGPYIHPHERAEHGEGFWVDHWTYNLDLIESFLAIYPEKLRSMLLEKADYTFYDNDHYVRPRAEKYFIHNGAVRQYQAVQADKERAAVIAKRPKLPSAVRTGYGEGEVYRTVLFTKLLCLVTNKLASLDSSGSGIEMEADKPGWYDALNGLPGLLGSSLCETFELKRLILFLLQSMDELEVRPKDRLAMPEELAEFVLELSALLSRNLRSRLEGADFTFWDAATGAKEEYRASIREGLSGKEKSLTFADIKTFLEHGRQKLEIGIERSFDSKTGLYPTYFENEVVEHKLFKGAIHPVRFKQAPLPYFLEGPVHALKVEKDAARRRQLVKAVRESGLYDKKLGMYKVNAPMSAAKLEVGRGRVFSPGWLENESIWLHMEYKFMLELIKNGLPEEFFADFTKVLVPFQPAERYGRSVLENSSFIVSSMFMDPSLHGTGFVARLSGSTAEFLHMWLLMNVGKKPFTMGADKKISLRFEPQLPSTLFLKEDAIRSYRNRQGDEVKVKIPRNGLAFLFLGKTLVVYHNPKRLDTYGKMRATVRRIVLTDTKGKTVEFKGDVIPAPYAERVRDEFFPRIDMELG